jgi:hypothetical protein
MLNPSEGPYFRELIKKINQGEINGKIGIQTPFKDRFPH